MLALHTMNSFENTPVSTRYLTPLIAQYYAPLPLSSLNIFKLTSHNPVSPLSFSVRVAGNHRVYMLYKVTNQNTAFLTTLLVKALEFHGKSYP